MSLLGYSIRNNPFLRTALFILLQSETPSNSKLQAPNHPGHMTEHITTSIAITASTFVLLQHSHRQCLNTDSLLQGKRSNFSQEKVKQMTAILPKKFPWVRKQTYLDFDEIPSHLTDTALCSCEAPQHGWFCIFLKCTATTKIACDINCTRLTGEQQWNQWYARWNVLTAMRANAQSFGLYLGGRDAATQRANARTCWNKTAQSSKLHEPSKLAETNINSTEHTLKECRMCISLVKRHLASDKTAQTFFFADTQKPTATHSPTCNSHRAVSLLTGAHTQN